MRHPERQLQLHLVLLQILQLPALRPSPAGATVSARHAGLHKGLRHMGFSASEAVASSVASRYLHKPRGLGQVESRLHKARPHGEGGLVAVQRWLELRLSVSCAGHKLYC